MKTYYLIIISLLMWCGYLCIQLAHARMDLTHEGNEARHYMEVQQAYYDGVKDQQNNQVQD